MNIPKALIVLVLAFVIILGYWSNTGSVLRGTPDLSVVSNREADITCESSCAHGDCIADTCFCDKGFSGQWCTEGGKPSCTRDDTDESGFVQCAAFVQGLGTTKIPPEMSEYWHKAQSWELDVWLSTTTFEDRVDQHLAWFQQYRALEKLVGEGKLRLGNVVEIGCGPFTQSIAMLRKVGFSTLDSLTLVDPLIDLYLQKVQKVPYRDNRFLFDKPTHLIRMGAEDAGIFLRPSHYDTVMMLNVIEHGTNAVKILAALWKLLKPGGILIFHEYDYEDRGFFWDVGHPIKLHRRTYDTLLNKLTVVFRQDFHHEGDYSHTSGVYFIGKKPYNS